MTKPQLVVNYCGMFMAITSAFTHVFLWDSSAIIQQFNAALRQIDSEDTLDIHTQLMKAYPDVPEYAFLLFLGILVLLQIGVSQFTAFGMPIWAVLLCVFISIVSVLPIGIITAASGQRIGFNVMSEFIIGLLIPGKTVAVMAFKR